MSQKKYDDTPYISYSGMNTFLSCAYRYWLHYDGKVPPVLLDDALGSIYGTAIGKVFEVFYRDELWRQKALLSRLQALVPDIVEGTLKEIRPGQVLLWRGEGPNQNPKGLYESPEDIIRDVQGSIPQGLMTIKDQRLIGSETEVEHKLDSLIGGFVIGGRADITMLTSYGKLRIILDGKGSRRRDKWVDKKQLWWYAMLYRERYGMLPDRVAFVYWKFEPPVGIQWFEVTAAEIDELKQEVVQTMSHLVKMRAELPPKSSLPVVQEVFKPAPSSENCRFCPYADISTCPEGHSVNGKAKAKAQKTADQR